MDAGAGAVAGLAAQVHHQGAASLGQVTSSRDPTAERSQTLGSPKSQQPVTGWSPDRPTAQVAADGTWPSK